MKQQNKAHLQSKLIRIALVYVLAFFSSAASAGASGDAVIDAFITNLQMSAGNSGGGVDDGGVQFTYCNSNGALPTEQNCPNDVTYTPSQHTGGYQAWGVGLTKVIPFMLINRCWFIPTLVITGDGLQILWLYRCYPSEEQLSPITLGAAYMRVKWGGDTGTAEGETVTKSTAAFKENVLTECVPVPDNMEAPCGDSSDATYVDDSGFELKVYIPDPACNMPILHGNFRYGDSRDLAYNCFLSSAGGWESDLPSAYLDTTLLDDEEDFLISVGTANPSGITEGTMYFSKVLFYSNGVYDSGSNLSTMESIASRHLGAVSVYLSSECVYGNPEPEFCFFNVDQTNLSATSTFSFN